VPKGREYIPGVVKRGDSSTGAVIRGVPGKANSYPLEYTGKRVYNIISWTTVGVLVVLSVVYLGSLLGT